MFDILLLITIVKIEFNIFSIFFCFIQYLYLGEFSNDRELWSKRKKKKKKKLSKVTRYRSIY